MSKNGKNTTEKTVGWSSRITDIYLTLITTVFLLYTGSQGYLQITGDKAKLFWILTGAYIAACAVCRVTELKSNRIELSSFTPVQWCIIAYAVLTFIAWLLSDYRKESFLGISRYEGLLTILMYCLLALCVSHFAKPGKWMLGVFLAGLTVFCAIAYIQFTGANPFGLYPGSVNYYDANKAYMGAYISTIGNVDLASAFLSPVTAALLVAVYRFKGWPKWASLAGAVISASVLIKIYVKSGFLGLGAGLLLAIPFVLRADKNKQKKLIILIAILIIAGIAAVYFVNFRTGMFHELHEILHGNLDPDFGTGRIAIWTRVLKKIQDRWAFGYGPDTMLAARIDPWAWEWVNDDTVIHTFIDTAHNEYLNVWYHQGIFAMIAFIGMIAAALIRLAKTERRDDTSVVLGAFVLTYAIQAFFNMSMNLTAVYFWIALGMLDGRLRNAGEHHD